MSRTTTTPRPLVSPLMSPFVRERNGEVRINTITETVCRKRRHARGIETGVETFIGGSMRRVYKVNSHGRGRSDEQIFGVSLDVERNKNHKVYVNQRFETDKMGGGTVVQVGKKYG